MKKFVRSTPVLAIQFKEAEFHKDPLRYISVLDKAMSSSTWADKSAVDGRYYIMNQTNTKPFSDIQTVGEGDYVVHDNGHTYIIPQHTFEEIYKEVE